MVYELQFYVLRSTPYGAQETESGYTLVEYLLAFQLAIKPEFASSCQAILVLFVPGSALSKMPVFMSTFIRSIFPYANIGSSGGSVRKKLFPWLLSAMKTGHGELHTDELLTGELQTAITILPTEIIRSLRWTRLQLKSRDPLLLGIKLLLRIRTSYDSHSVYRSKYSLSVY